MRIVGLKQLQQSSLVSVRCNLFAEDQRVGASDGGALVLSLSRRLMSGKTLQGHPASEAKPLSRALRKQMVCAFVQLLGAGASDSQELSLLSDKHGITGLFYGKMRRIGQK